MTPIFHPTYYLKDGVVFLVQNTFFKIPRYMLESSSASFTQLLADVPSNNETKPVQLANITASEFEHLLLFLYPLTPPSTTTPAVALDIPQWISILRLATLYDMPTLGALARQLLSTHVQDPLLKISLGRSYGYTPWIKEGFALMCLRKQPLSIEEGETLSKEDVIRVAAAREEIRMRVNNVGLDGVVVGRKMIKGREDNTESTEYDLLLKNRSLRQIINHAFHFPLDSTDLDAELDADSSSSPSPVPVRFSWPSLNLMELCIPRIFWLVKSPSDIPHTYRKLKNLGIPHVDVDNDRSSIITVDDFVEGHSLRDKLKGLDLVKKIQARAGSLNLKAVVAVSIVAGVVSVIGSSVVA